MMAKPRRRLPREVRERQIIDAALQVFSQQGYHATSVDDIADFAGISKPMVYMYLGSKEGLFVACVRRESERLAGAFREATKEAGNTAEARLWAGLRTFFGFVAEHRDGWDVLLWQPTGLGESVGAELELARNAATREIVALVREGAELYQGARTSVPDADFVTHLVVGAVTSLARWMTRHPDADPDLVARRVMNLLWMGMHQTLEGVTWAPENIRADDRTHG